MALSEKESVERKSRFSEEKMVQILRETDRTPMGEVAKQYGISEQTIYNWRRHFGSTDSADVKRLRELEQENARLKKMVADATPGFSSRMSLVLIQIVALHCHKKMVSAQARREQARFAVSRGLSQRRACALLSTGWYITPPSSSSTSIAIAAGPRSSKSAYAVGHPPARQSGPAVQRPSATINTRMNPKRLLASATGTNNHVRRDTRLLIQNVARSHPDRRATPSV
jgi:putative transposase